MNSTTLEGEVKRRLKLSVSHIEHAIGLLNAKGDDADKVVIENMREAIKKIKQTLDQL